MTLWSIVEKYGIKVNELNLLNVDPFYSHIWNYNLSIFLM
jgi:hypothetical protein